MIIATKAGLSVGALPAVLLLAACGPFNSASGSPSPSGTAASPSGTAAASPAVSTASATPSPGAPATDSGTGNDCTAADLKISPGISAGPSAASDGMSVMVFNLDASASCTMDGYPGVDLVGIDKATGQQTRISVARDGENVSETNVSRGDAGMFGVHYAASPRSPSSSPSPSSPSSPSSSEFQVTGMIVTPPNTYQPISYSLAGPRWSRPWLIKTASGQLQAKVSPVSPGGHA